MPFDPIRLEIIGNKLSAIVDEMYFSIRHASRSSYVKEAADFATAILDLDGNIFAYPPSATFNFLVDSHFIDTIRAVPDLAPGDVILTNDPYLSGGLSTHLPDFHLIRPYFKDERCIAYGWSFVHCADVGGAVPSSMSPALTDIFQEGLRLPPLKLIRGGAVNQDVMAIIRANTRTPETTMGDLQAMLGALALGELRLAEAADRFGTEALLQAATELQDYAAARSRAAFRRIPDGAYDFWDYMDDDYVSRIPVRIRVRLVAHDGEVLLDLADTDPQVRTAYNVPTMGQRIYWLSFRITSFLTTLDPTIPKNAGMYRHVRVQNQPGSILDAEFPDAVNIRASAPYRLFDAITGALIKATPELMPAATGGTMMPFAFAEPGIGGASRKVEVIEPLRCGMGAFKGQDGVDARDNSLNNMRNHPLELVESNSSVLVLDYDIRCDSGGPGQWRGGVGQMMTIEALTDDGVIVGRGMERVRFQPFGVTGGRPGATLQAILNKGRPDERRLGKIHELPLARGDTLTLLMPGGGGYGDPLDRDPLLVLADVQNGFVSHRAAARDYGVLLRDDIVDAPATQALRASLRGSSPPAAFDFGPERDAWEAVFDDRVMAELNRRLYRLPKARRHGVRRQIFETVAPGLATGAGSLREALGPVDAARGRLCEQMDRLLPGAA